MIYLSVFFIFLGTYQVYGIRNGTLATEGEFPYLVALREEGNYVCPAVILDKIHILVAARCVTPSDEFQTLYNTIQYGKVNITNDNVNTIRVIDACWPPDLDEEDWENWDFAVLKLEKPLPDNSSDWQPVKLLHEDVIINETVPAYSAGWGADKVYGAPLEYLQKLDVEIQPNGSCGEAPYFYCALSGGSFCTGDASAPLMLKDGYFIGHGYFFGDWTCNPHDKYNFLRIAYHYDMIQRMLNLRWTSDLCKHH